MYCVHPERPFDIFVAPLLCYYNITNSRKVYNLYVIDVGIVATIRDKMQK
jgi:hypothetical protein